MPDEKKDSDMVSETTSEGSGDEGKSSKKADKIIVELKDENAKRRIENTELRERLDKIEKERVEDRKALLTSLGMKDDKEDPLVVLKSTVDSLNKRLEESNLNIAKEKLFNTFTGEALKAGVNPDLIGDAWRLTDGVTFENVNEVVKSLKEKKPFLFAKGKEDVGAELQPGKSDKSYPAVIVAISKETGQPIEWIEEKAKEFMARHKDKYKNVEAAAMARFGKPTVVEYKSLRNP